MPSHLHETLISLLREQPNFATQLLRDVLGIAIEDRASLRTSSETFSEMTPAEFRADAVLELRRLDGGLERAVIFEVQLRWSAQKLLRWPMYVAGVRARLGCPTLLVVVTLDRTVAQRYATPIDLDGRGHRSVLEPCVIGPDEIPRITDPSDADHCPELAVFSAIAHPNGPEAVDIGRCALSASAKLDDERSRLYSDIIFAYLGTTARVHLEAEMGLENYEYQSTFAKHFIAKGEAEGRARGLEQGLEQGRARGLEQGLEQGRARGLEQGRAQGHRESLFAVLEARALPLTDEQRRHIEACNDPGQLERWTRQAVVVHSVDELLDNSKST